MNVPVQLMESGLPAAAGMQYLDVFARLHKALEPEWYLEVGTQTGASLRLASARSISVDPQYLIKHEFVGTKPECLLFQQTSDDFFASGRLEQLGCRIDLAFLDGMHLFEYLLRDFMNAEAFMAPDGLVVLHDCLPRSANMAVRDRAECRTRAWTGDVWKLVPILRQYRPDLKVEILDAAPTGLVLISNLDPANTVLKQRYDEIVAAYVDADLVQSDVLGDLQVQSAESSPWISAPPVQAQPAPNSVSIKLAAPNRQAMTSWGDYHFAQGMAEALERLGYSVDIAPQDEWYREQRPGGIDLALRGRTNFNRVAGRRSVFWAISKPMRPINLPNADLVLSASQEECASLEARPDAPAVGFMPQAFDSAILKPRQTLRGEGVVFVGRAARGGETRPAVQYALQSAAVTDLGLWGPGWEKGASAPYHLGAYLPNDQLGRVYSAADIVLNDHTAMMAGRGFLSNRIFDTLACGAVPVTDRCSSVPEDLAEFVYMFDDQDSFDAAIEAARTESDAKRRARLELAAEMPQRHSFDARARQLVAMLETCTTEAGS